MAAESTSSVKRLWGEDRDAKRVAVVMVVALGFGGAVVWFALPNMPSQLAGLLWAAAWSSIGWFLGFLFGIPRYLSTDTARTPAAQELDKAQKIVDSASAVSAASRAAADAAANAMAEADKQSEEKARAAQTALSLATEAARVAEQDPTNADLAAAAKAAKLSADEASGASDAAAKAATEASTLSRLTAEKSKSDDAALVEAKSSLANASAKPATASGASITVNTNLEQISDWLTKIIVGVALVEIKTLIEQMEKAAAFMANSLGGATATSFCFAIMLYFLVSGLLGSYLLTRLFLQGALADAARAGSGQG